MLYSARIPATPERDERQIIMRRILDQIGRKLAAVLSDHANGEVGRKAMHPQAYPPLHEGESIYAIGDVHGRRDCLEALHEKIDTDRSQRMPRKTIEIYVGDYVDRGPDSAGVIDLLIRRAQKCPCIFLRGNHEQMFIDVLEGAMEIAAWRDVGGLETIRSYGVDPRRITADPLLAPLLFREAVPATHKAFLAALQPMTTLAGYIFVHAGLRPGIAPERQNPLDLMWIREEFTLSDTDFGAIVVHGHTPVSEPECLSNRVNLDTGAYATGRLSFCRIDMEGLTVETVAQ